MAEVRTANFVRTTIADAGGISAVATSVTLASVTGMPTLAAGNWTYFVITRLSDNATEIVKVTAIDTATKIATIVRAQGGTTGKIFILGNRIELWFVADMLNDLRTQWQAEIQASLVNTITRGSILVGGVSNVPTELVCKSSGYILVGDGTDLKSVVTSGDVTISAAGALTLGANKVITTKVLDNNITLAKIVAASAQGKLLGRSTAAAGNWEEIACDGSTLELAVGGALQVKALGIGTAQLTNLGVTTGKYADNSVTSAKIDEGVLKFSEVDLTFDDVRNLFVTPIQLVAAPGAGKAIIFDSAVVILEYAGVAYNNEYLRVRYTDAAGTIISTDCTAVLNSGANIVKTMKRIVTDVAVTVNAKIVLHCTAATGATGTSPLRLKVSYRIISTGL